MDNKVTVEDMMYAREMRAYAQTCLLKENPGVSLVCLTLNIMGEVKSSPLIEGFFRWAMEVTEGAININDVVSCSTHIGEKTGSEVIWCIKGDPFAVKKHMIQLEDTSPACRLLDIDVIKTDGTKISRTDVGYPARKCLMCENEAVYCARARKHPLTEMVSKANELMLHQLRQSFIYNVGEKAEAALMVEALASPKPGLVDRIDQGAHKDMDIFTFAKSACCCRKYFEKCVETGISTQGKPGEECFEALRLQGLECEHHMLTTTQGINTHKGAIFSIGLYCAALGRQFMIEAPSSDKVFDEVARMTCPSLKKEMEELAAKKEGFSTAGEKIYSMYKAGGIREEAASGFSTVKNHSLPCYKRCISSGISLNDSCLITLLVIIANTRDTNLIKRGGSKGMRHASALAKRLIRHIDKYGYNGKYLHDKMEEMNSDFVLYNLSPGGSADLLSLTVLACSMEPVKEGGCP